MSTARCQGCGAPLDTSSGEGLCPACVLRDALRTSDQDEMDPVPPTGLALPRKFGSYELLKEIGRGGMGVVYAARQSGLGRTVAVKLLLSGVHASETALQRFHTEAAAAAGLQHPNIVEIHEYGEVEGQPFYAMDMVDGHSLGELCAARPFEAVRAAWLLREMARAVHYAHRQGILHRDLKPSNVLVDQEGRPRITDFGLARRLEESGGVTQTGEMLGSPGYAAPEQAAGRVQEIGAPTDVYGLGAVLYHLLTGRAPFNAATPTETLRLVLESDPVAPRLLNPAVPRDLETVCMKCLAKEPERRYATAADVEEDLARFLEHRPILARSPSLVYRARKFVRRYRTGVVAVAVVVVALAAGLTLALLGYRRAVEQQQAANAARARSQEMINFIMQKSLPDQLKLGRRQAMIDTAEMAVHYFDQLPAALQDRNTLRAHATALDLLVQAYGNTWWRFTNRNREAGRAAVGRARALWQQLAESDPTDADAMAAALFDEYLEVLEDTRRPPTRLETAEDDLVSRFRVLEGRFPRNRAVQLGLERLLHMRAYNNGGCRDPLDALASGREACERVDRLRAENSADVTMLWEQAWAYTAFAAAYARSGDAETAVRRQKMALSVAEELLSKDPTNVSSLEVAVNMALRLVWREPTLEEKHGQIRDLRNFLSTLLALDPDDPEWRLIEVFALEQEAWVQFGDRQPREAFETESLAVTRWESIPPEFRRPDSRARDIALAGAFAAAAGDRASAADNLRRLRDEFMNWADNGENARERGLRRFRSLYFQSEIVFWLRDWVEMERLGREMLAEAESRASDAPDSPILEPVFRAAAQSILGTAILGQGNSPEAVAFLEQALARFSENPSLAPFHQYVFPGPLETAESLARALDQREDRHRIVELLEWAFAGRDARAGKGSAILDRVALAECALQLAEALDPQNTEQAARRHEVLSHAAEILNDPGTASRLTPEELELRAQIASALVGSRPDPRRT